MILCRTQMGENIGTAARAMLNFGLTELRLVAPQCGWPNAKAVVAASGAALVLNRLEVFKDLAAATADLHHTLATTARPREMAKPVLGPEARRPRAWRRRRRAGGSASCSGRSAPGSPTTSCCWPTRWSPIPVNPEFSSLNLAQAVLLFGYAWYRQTAR